MTSRRKFIERLVLAAVVAAAGALPTFAEGSATAPTATVSPPTDKAVADARAAKLAERDRLWDESHQLAGEGKHAEALELAEDVLPIEIALFGERHAEVSGTLGWIAAECLASERFADAIAAYERQIKILIAIHHGNTWEVADVRRNIENAKHRSTLTADQRNNLQRASMITARTRALYERGQYHEAVTLTRQALAARLGILGEQHVDTVESLNILGLLLHKKGDYAAARLYYERALAINRKILGEEHPDTASAINNLGVLFLSLGDYAASRSYHEQALAIRRKILGEEHPDTAFSLNSLGVLLVEVGDYAAARPFYEQALAINREVHGEEHPETAGSLNNLGSLLLSTGDVAAARPYYEQALAILRKVFGDEHPDTAVSLDSMGSLLLSTEDYAAARPYYEQALAIRRKVFGDEHPDTAVSFNSLGSLLESTEDYAAAQTHYEQALAIRRKVLGPEHPATVQSLNNLGVLLASLGDYAAARPCFEQCLAISRKVLGEEHPDLARSLSNLGGVLAATGKHAEAADQFLAAEAIQQHLLDRELVTLSEEKMQLFFGTGTANFALLASLPLTNLHREGDAAALFLSRKAIAFEIANRRRAAEFLASTDATVAKRKSQLLFVQKQRDDLAMQPPKGASPQELAARRQTLRRESEELENQLSRALAVFLGTDASLAVSPDDVRGKLPGGSALVEFVRYYPFNFQATRKTPRWGDAKYAAFVLAADSRRQVGYVDLGPAAEIDELVGELSGQVRQYQRSLRTALGDEAGAEKSYRDVAGKLYAKLLAPLNASLAGAKRIYLGPDSRLHEISFEALVDDSGEYLVEAGYQFAYVNSGRDLVRPRSDESGDGVFVFAGPNYDLTADRRLAEAERLGGRGSVRAAAGSAVVAGPARQETSTPFGANPLRARQELLTPGRIPRAADTRIGWRRLPGFVLEGKEAGAAFAGGQWGEVHVYMGDEALEDVVKQVRRPRALVVVTHGDFLEDLPQFLVRDAEGSRSFGELGFERVFGEQRGGAGMARAGLRATEDPMLRSYLLLAGANKIDEPVPPGKTLDNGWLTAQEISQLDLRGTDLVVLSACNTSRGKAANGQAVTGMRSAFLFAGARTIVGSLYEVPDAQTRELLKPFYEQVAAGQGKLASLNAAKLAFMETRRKETGAAHPFYWASFVLVGEP